MNMTACRSHSGVFEKAISFDRVGKKISFTTKAKRDFIWSREGRNSEQFISAAGALFVPFV